MTVGIDLGTTNSVVAFVDGEHVRAIPNGRGKLVTPSVVGLDSHGRFIVGEAARNQRINSPRNTIALVKRQMGERTTLAVGTNRYSPEEISGEILRSMKEIADRYFGASVREAVVTVPAHFDDRQRLATAEAALLAGFERVQLLNEPTAAALPYASRGTHRERLVVFDFGGGTLDVTCVERTGQEVTVRSSMGDGALGGQDIDELVAGFIRSELGIDGGHHPDGPAADALILQVAEQAKIDLSEMESTRISLPFLRGTTRSGGHLDISFSRAQLEKMIQPLVVRAEAVVRRAVSMAGFDRDGFDHLVLAGGSSRLPAIQAMLARNWDVPLAARVNPEDVIATGAALYAAKRVDGLFTLHEVLSSTLAVELADGTCVPLIRKNQTVPARTTRIFTTVSDGQAEADVHLLQGDARDAARNRSLGKFTLSGIASGPQGNARIAVTVEVDRDGLVTLKADDRHTGAREELVTRARPQLVQRPIAGPREAYSRSLQRRARALARVARGDIRVELEELLNIGPSEVIADLDTVLETLILEVVAENVHGRTEGARRAAS